VEAGNNNPSYNANTANNVSVLLQDLQERLSQKNEIEKKYLELQVTVVSQSEIIKKLQKENTKLENI